jgi:hypothetical protein
MRRATLVIALCAGLSTGLVACGDSADETSDIVPESVPELTVPPDTGLPAAPDRTDTTDTTSTTDTTATTTTQAAPAAPAAPTPAPATSTPQTGGTAPQQQQDDGADSGGFSDFCQQNPGACPGN